MVDRSTRYSGAFVFQNASCVGFWRVEVKDDLPEDEKRRMQTRRHLGESVIFSMFEKTSDTKGVTRLQDVAFGLLICRIRNPLILEDTLHNREANSFAYGSNFNIKVNVCPRF